MKMTQKTAFILAALLVLGSAWGKARLTFSSMQKQLDVVYTEGVDHDGQSIAQDIQAKQNTARNCVTVARRYDSAINASLITAVENAAENLDQADSMGERRRLEKPRFRRKTKPMSSASCRNIWPVRIGLNAIPIMRKPLRF